MRGDLEMERISKDEVGLEVRKEVSPSNDEQPDNVVSPDPVIKHPLENTWTMWYFKNDKQNKEWVDNLKEVTSVNTVEDFWSLFNYIERVSKLTSGCDYCFFKKGIKPMWEDDANKRGGKWIVNFDKKQRMAGEIDGLWLDVILGLIGETFEDSPGIINGAVVCNRPKADKIALWLRHFEPRDSVMKIGFKLKEQLGLHEKICFEDHADTMHRSSSHVKSRYSV